MSPLFARFDGREFFRRAEIFVCFAKATARVEVPVPTAFQLHSVFEWKPN